MRTGKSVVVVREKMLSARMGRYRIANGYSTILNTKQRTTLHFFSGSE